MQAAGEDQVIVVTLEENSVKITIGQKGAPCRGRGTSRVVLEAHSRMLWLCLTEFNCPRLKKPSFTPSFQEHIFSPHPRQGFSVALESVLELALTDQADLEVTEIRLSLPPKCRARNTF